MSNWKLYLFLYIWTKCFWWNLYQLLVFWFPQVAVIVKHLETNMPSFGLCVLTGPGWNSRTRTTSFTFHQYPWGERCWWGERKNREWKLFGSGGRETGATFSSGVPESALILFWFKFYRLTEKILLCCVICTEFSQRKNLFNNSKCWPRCLWKLCLENVMNSRKRLWCFVQGLY